MRYIGVDLHTTQITVCYLKAESECSIRKYQLVELDKFINTLESGDEIAVEATCNTRMRSDQVAEKVRRSGHGEIRVSLKWSRIRSRKRTRMTRWIWRSFSKQICCRKCGPSGKKRRKCNLWSIRERNWCDAKTSLINKIHALFVSTGRKLKKTGLSSEKGLDTVLLQEWSAIERIEVEIIIEQIRSLKVSIKKLDKAIETESGKLKGFESLVSMSGIGSLSAGISVVGDWKYQRLWNGRQIGKLFRDRAARVELQWNHQSRTNHETRKQNRTDNAGAMQFIGHQEKWVFEKVLRTSQSAARTWESENRIGKEVFGNNLQHFNKWLGVCRFQ